jgi:guanylate kinase
MYQIILIIAPSGAGKSSLVNALLKRHDDIALSVSYTTRAMRAGEEDGREYHFIDQKQFEEMKTQGDFVESAYVHGNYYGTSASWLTQKLKNSHVLLEIDYQGAAQICQQFKNTVQIFILPPDFKTLRKRLLDRGTDSLEIIEKRLENAKKEIAYLPLTDFCVVNDHFEKALADIEQIIAVQKFRSQYVDLETTNFYNNI